MKTISATLHIAVRKERGLFREDIDFVELEPADIEAAALAKLAKAKKEEGVDFDEEAERVFDLMRIEF